MTIAITSDLIEKLIVKYKPDEEFFIMDNEEGGLEIYFRLIHFTIKKNDKWVEVKKRIDAILDKNKIKNICEICEKPMGIVGNKRVNCNQCCNQCCYSCYIEIFKTNKGLSICPFCRYTHGQKLPDCLVELGVLEMKMKNNM